MCSSQKADETAYKVSAPPDTPIYVGEWRGVRFFVGCNIKMFILQNGIENWQCPAEATGTAFIAPIVALTDITPCRSDMLSLFGRMVLRSYASCLDGRANGLTCAFFLTELRYDRVQGKPHS